MKEQDIRKKDTIIVYDKTEINNAYRALSMFSKHGVSVAILNGTFTKWHAENRQVESGDRPSAWTRVREGEIGSNHDDSFIVIPPEVESSNDKSDDDWGDWGDGGD